MNLISKIKRASVLSVAAMSALMFSGGLSTNATNPSGCVSAAQEDKFADFSSVGNYVLQTIRQIGGKPAMILIPKINYSMGDEIIATIPQNTAPGIIEFARHKISLIGKPVPISTLDFASYNDQMQCVIAYIPQAKGVRDESKSILIPQVIETKGESIPIFVPKQLDLIGTPIPLYNKLNVKPSVQPTAAPANAPMASPSTVATHAHPMGSQKAPVVPARIVNQAMTAAAPQKTLVNPEADQLKYIASLPKVSAAKASSCVQAPQKSSASGKLLPSYASVFANTAVANFSKPNSGFPVDQCMERHYLKSAQNQRNIDASEKSVLSRNLLEVPQPSTPIMSAQAGQTNCITPEKNKTDLGKIPPVGYLAPRPVRRESRLSCDEIRISSRKLDFSKTSTETQQLSSQLSAKPGNEVKKIYIKSEQKAYTTSQKKDLVLNQSSARSNGVQKTTLQNPQKPISALRHEEKKVKKTIEVPNPDYICID